MKKIKYSICVLIIVLFVSACVRDIAVELPRGKDKLIVEAYIDLDSVAVVYLTKSISYFDPISTANLNDYVVSGNQAEVIVSDGVNSETLIPATFDKYPYVGYKGISITGKTGGEYSLTINYNEKQYTAKTTIPETVPIDSIWYENSNWFPKDSLGPLGIVWNDPGSQIGNYYIIKARVEGKHNEFYGPYITINLYDDRLENGQPMMFFPFFMPYDGNDYYGQDIDTSVSFVNYLFYKVGDTVSFKLSSMDRFTFLFWNSWYRNMVTDGNPFANPASIVSNIEGDDVEGVWGGYGTDIKTVVIKDSVTVEYINLW